MMVDVMADVMVICLKHCRSQFAAAVFTTQSVLCQVL